MHYNIIKTAAHARTRLRLPMVWKADAVAAEKLPEAGFWVFIGGERVRVEKTPGSDDEYIFPALQSGQYAWDLVVDAQVVLHGVLKVRGSAVPPGGGEVCGTLLVEAPAMVLVHAPGPRGEVGPQGVQGFSAYEVAVQHGYEGSEADWAEELSGAQAAATESKRQAGLSASSATEAAESATAAQQSVTAAGVSASAAAQSATAATSSATTAGTHAGAAAQSATAADKSAAAAKKEAARANTEADRANAAMTEIENNLLPAAQAAKNYAESAKTAAIAAAGNAGSSATEAGNQADAAEQFAEDAEEYATAAEVSATAAAKSASDAATTLAGAAQVDENNVFTATNTFNGALVANGSLLYEQQELGNLLKYPVAAWLIENGLHPASALAKSWDEWVALNPNWSTLEHLLFYAPLLQGSIPQLTSATSVSSCTYISPALTNNTGCQYLLGRKFNIFTLGTNGQDAGHCYNGVQGYYYAPRVMRLVSSLNAFALSSAANTAELSVFTPELKAIEQSNVDNAGNTFRRLGTLKTFSIYAPKLVTSFRFADASGSKAQYCSVLQSLVAGIGTPDTEQTITTRTPIDNEPENISALRTAASDKNWKFNFV